MTTEWTHAQQARLNDVNLHRASLLMQADALLKEAQDLTKARDEAVNATRSALVDFLRRGNFAISGTEHIAANRMVAYATELRTLLAPFDPTHKPAAPTDVQVNPLIPLAGDLRDELVRAQQIIGLLYKFIPISDEAFFRNTAGKAGFSCDDCPPRDDERKTLIKRAETFFASEKKQ